MGRDEAKSFGSHYSPETDDLPPHLRKLPHGAAYFDIPAQDLFLEALEDGGDPIMLDLLDPPAVLMGTLAGIVGPDIRLCGVQPRTVIPEPPDDQGVAASYTSW